MKRFIAIAFLASLWLAAPTTASAHVGRSPALAVDDRARITRIEPRAAPFQVRVVDGDQDLWLRLAPGNDLVVLGTIGEPFLRFNGGGVFGNTRSSTAQADLFGLIPYRRSSLNPQKAPSWWKLSSTATYVWHDHRLHALAFLSSGGPARRLGEWKIPLRLNGSPAAIVGGLWSVPPPTRWFWPVISLLIVAAVVAILRSRSWRVAAIGGPTLAAITTVAVFTTRAGRDLYGRPDISTGRYVSLGVSLALGALILDRLLRAGHGTNLLVAMVVGVIGLVQGLTLLPTFWHGLVLVAIPNWMERICAALCLGAGAGSLIFSFADTKVDLNQPADAGDH